MSDLQQAVGEAPLPPIQVSPQAQRALTGKVRQWTGWKNAGLVFGQPDHKVSPIAMCDHEKRMITVDPEFTLLNPNRVLLTVTPFRLRQEAVLTGALLHEAGHARHTHWKPCTAEEIHTKPLLHGDGSTPTAQAFALAKLMEEPRVEALMARDANDIGATGLAWTMRAMAAHLLPPTELSPDPSQALMDLVSSWALRAGRQIGIKHHDRTYRLPGWVAQFTSLLHQTIEAHLEDRVAAGAVLVDVAKSGGTETPNYRSLQIIAALNEMIQCADDTGPTMIDLARDVLTMLFPETNDDSDASDGQAMASGGCAVSAEAEGKGGEGDEAGSEGKVNTEPEDEGSGDDPGAGDSGDDEDTDPETGEDTTADDSPEQGESEDQDGDEADSPAGGGSEDESPGATDSTPAQQALAKALAELEAESGEETTTEAEGEASQAPPLETGGTAGGSGSGGSGGGGWRAPNVEEREVAKGAERFLRDMIDASETSKRMLTDQPSATVDGGALAAWKAGGQVREPHFFIRTKRTIEPSPPIKIAILVDVSASMDVLQKPSALLSWALANAALDLRNFAGRGQQVESCLIHWGDKVKVIQKPGQILPGIREYPCDQGTSNMHGALAKIEEVMPGFYDQSNSPANRLIVQFTDWKVFKVADTTTAVGKALAAGVNMLSVVPSNYSHGYTPLSTVLAGCKIQRGATSLVKYQSGNPGAVWDQAAEALDRRAPTPTTTSADPTDDAGFYGF